MVSVSTVTVSELVGLRLASSMRRALELKLAHRFRVGLSAGPVGKGF